VTNKVVSIKSVLSIFAHDRFVSERLALDKIAFVLSVSSNRVSVKSPSDRSTPVRFALFNIPFNYLDPDIFTLYMFGPLKSTPVRSNPERFVSERSYSLIHSCPRILINSLIWGFVSFISFAFGGKSSVLM
jgi:hypothetical protein